MLLISGFGTAHAQSPALSIADATTLEGNSGARELLFPVTLSQAQSFDVSASFKTRDISATAPGDYTAQLAGQIVIKAGQTRANVSIRIVTDRIEESHESFLVQLGAPKGAYISDSDAIGHITDDDYNGQVSISDTSFTELNSGQKVAKVQVTFSTAPLHEIAVNYETKDDSAKATSADYLPARGTLLFRPGRLILTIAVFIIGDTFAERDEQFLVRLASTECLIAKPLGTIAILNDDFDPSPPPPVAVSISDVSVEESDGGLPETQLLVSLAAPAAQALEIRYSTFDGSAQAGSDYVAKQGVLSFESGQTTAPITFQLGGDIIEEADESFSVQLSAPGGLTGDTSGTVSIRDDDYNGVIIVNRLPFLEGDSAQKPVSVEVMPSTPPLHPLLISYLTRSNTAVSPGDFVASQGTLAIPTGARAVPLPLTLVGDTILEGEEIFYLDLSNSSPNNDFWFRENRIELTIRDNDPFAASNLAGKIAFHLNRDGQNEIYAINADGTGQTRLTNNAASDTAAVWSPDGQKIAFQSDRDGNSEIYVMGADGSNPTRLTNNAATDSSPAWSPDGRKIVFESDRLGGGPFGRAGVFRLWVMPSDGTAAAAQIPADLPRAEANLSFKNPSWSPQNGLNGTRIAYALPSALGLTHVELMGHGTVPLTVTAGGSAPVLAANIKTPGGPAFSPDGTLIVYALYAGARTGTTSQVVHPFQIYLMNSNGSEQTRLTVTSNSDQNPCFSPDSRFIAFGSTRGDGSGIWVMKADGSSEIRLAAGEDPSWTSGSVSSARKASLVPKPSGGGS